MYTPHPPAEVWDAPSDSPPIRAVCLKEKKNESSFTGVKPGKLPRWPDVQSPCQLQQSHL